MQYKIRYIIMLVLGIAMLALNFAFAPLGPASGTINVEALSELQQYVLGCFLFVVCPLGGAILAGTGIFSLWEMNKTR